MTRVRTNTGGTGGEQPAPHVAHVPLRVPYTRPCDRPGGPNGNVCVAEGCHGEACIGAALEDARFHHVVSAELVACTPGQRERLELRTDGASRDLCLLMAQLMGWPHKHLLRRLKRRVRPEGIEPPTR